MSKLKIEYGASRTERVKLQVSIDVSVASDIELMAQWSDNEKNYIVNELLRFALSESAEFQQYKQTPSNEAQAKQPGSDAVERKNAAVSVASSLHTSEVAR